ncbi:MULTISPECIES: dihydrodipicolinate synthase family protein [Actinoalloteichus]|uniref:Dihydrodipicolinate synthase/N-acetylneuraminate lyase n=1 Tax=Actinoalloteichus fjordicus TaxID=1612552 RepID=A0AAC9LH18_9PSEU|nr:MULTISPECIES: dihydrodipicolinate synthase family protein [Actinoalloteichus]APU16734.1 dihydrodipicolinate synthase/N-acetylneuraminate lyase [Actinoalloteichus fjordicus]APU22800.1 dihydrodipicolinate synthase/N-acetylneuraminate lyase [Actinoalloteichus sp. GBA129-24]
MTLKLPTSTGEFLDYVPRSTGALDARGPSPTSRVLYAAAHVVADPLADNTPGRPARPDWEATMAFRRHLWAHGLGVADAMDTAQRGMGLDWPTAAELIRRSGAEAKELGGLLACGVGTDQVREDTTSLDDVIAGYVEQAAVVQDAGATVILMASRRLAAVARGPEDYHRVYSTLLEQLDSPAILHWLGPMFDPALTGYWGSTDLDLATEVFLDVIKAHSDKVDGVKMSLLDADREIGVRRRLPDGVRCYTGDDFHYPELIKGDDQGHSDALLGIFDAIAPAAAAALRRLDAGDVESYDQIMAPTVPLSRHIFGTPTYYYKTGIVFLAWLAGHQEHFRMVGGLESARSVPHLARLYVLADEAGLLPDAELAERRMRQFLDLAGVPQ